MILKKAAYVQVSDLISTELNRETIIKDCVFQGLAYIVKIHLLL